MSSIQEKRYSPRLHAVPIELSDLQYSCSIWDVPRTHYTAGLIEFRGAYRPGSAGDADARFIHWRINVFAEISRYGPIAGLVVDFRQMSYQWGDALEIRPSRWREVRPPVRAVVSSKMHEAYVGVLGEQHVLTDLEIAFGQVTDQIRSGK